MTAIARESERGGRPRVAGNRLLRAAAWALHVLVSFLAVFSLCTNRFDLWLDLRLLGGVGTILVKIVWVATVLVIPWCAGPRLAWFGKGGAKWVHGGWWAQGASWLLWPTYFVMGCLIANSVFYYKLVRVGIVESPFPVPITLFAAGLLGAWAVMTREWVRQPAGKTVEAPITRRAEVLAGVFVLGMLVVVGGFFLLNVYSRPPRETVDLAVVLGNRVMPDGSASPILRDRTLAAVHLYKRGLVRHILLSGDVRPGEHGNPILRNEPRAMRQVCLDYGVPAGAISLDPRGVNTKATAFNARDFMRARGMKTVVACSDDFHLFRTMRSFKAVGIDAYTVPSVRQDWQCAEVSSVLREVAAIVVYQFDPNYRVPKEVSMKVDSPGIVVRKRAGVLELYGRARKGEPVSLLRTYACITGGNPGDKEAEGDRRTPIGEFRVVFKNPVSKFHLSLGLDYPTAADARRGLDAGVITQAQYDGIIEALRSDLSLVENQRKLWYTPLGGEIFIHGHAAGRTGTAGCVAVSNADIEEIYAAVEVGTTVRIEN